MKHYVYALINPIDDKIFYIGKGSGNRMYNHLKNAKALQNGKKISRGCNLKLLNKINSIVNFGVKLKYDKVFESDNEDDVYSYEEKLIDDIGLENLCNLTRGGKGGRAGYKHSEINREKFRLSLLENAIPANILANSGKPRGENYNNQREKARLQQRLVLSSPEIRKKAAATQRGVSVPTRGLPKGHIKSEKTKEKLSIITKKRMENPKEREKISKAVSKSLIGNTRSATPITILYNDEMIHFDSKNKLAEYFDLKWGDIQKIIKNPNYVRRKNFPPYPSFVVIE